ncbi:oxygenase MpaB family protein [Nocardia sp. NPDC050193]
MTSSQAPAQREIAHHSLLRRYLPDRRFLLTLPRAVALQILHPAIAASFTEHIHTGLWAHKQRTVDRMIGLACRDHPDPARVIRYAHEHVKGRDHTGARADRLAAQALHPPWWALGVVPGFAVRAVQHERATELLDITERPGDRMKFAAFSAALRMGARAPAPADRSPRHPPA